MKKLGSVVAALLLIATPSHSQVGFGGIIPGPGTVHSAGGGGYSGPSDAKAHAWFYGAIAASAAARGTNALEICDGASCVTVASDATTGIVPNPSPNGSNPCDITTHYCDVRTLYEQIGGGVGNAVQTTSANRAKWRPPGNCPSTFSASVGCLFTDANTRYSSSGTWTQAQPYGFSGGYNRDTGHGTDTTLLSASGVLAGGFFGAQNDIMCYAGSGSLDTSATDGIWHAASCTLNGSSSNMKVDNGSVGTGDAGAAAPSSTTVRIFWNGTNRPWYGYFLGGGGFAGSATSTDLANMNTAYKTIGGY